MNRTQLYLAAAAGLALVALMVGLPHFVVPAAAGGPLTVADASNGSLTMTARLSHPYVGLGRSDVFATVDLKAVEVPGSARTPVNLALVIDRSGSMAGEKINQAKLAAKALVGQLDERDRLTIVHYGSDVKSMPGLHATQENKQAMLQFIDGIWDDGGTNIGAGLTTARDLLLASKSDFKVNRLILISDGQPTEGLTDISALTELARSIRALGVSLSSIGVGTDFHEDLMTAFAEVGGGSYGYLKDASQLTTIFRKDLAQAGTQVARNVVLQFDLPEGVTLGEVLGYQAIQTGQSVAIAMPDFAAGQLDRVAVRLQVEGAVSGHTIDVSHLRLDYEDLLVNAHHATQMQLAAMVTDQNDVIARNRDKEATVFAARARSADNTRRAAEALSAGKPTEARQLLDQNAFFFEDAAKVAGPAAMATDQHENALMKKMFNEEDVGASAKAAKRKARMDYGLQGSTY